MIAPWMLYCLAVGALLSLGALAMERAMRAFALPQRWVWAVAMVGMLALPAAVRWMPRTPEPAPSSSAGSADAETPIRTIEFGGGGAESKPRIDISALDRPLAIGWMGMTATSLLALIAAWAVLERRRRGWRAVEVDGVPVLLSPATGPAVIGLFRSRIVLPQWVVADASDDVRALLLEHEREHLRAGDPRLLALGLAVVALMPWNPAAWWQLRRLRLAVEVDCDARVLARRADVRAYGTLLLEVGRRGTGGRLLAAAFSEPTSFLERRIRIMTSPRVKRPWVRAALFGAAALATVVAACEAPGPVQPAPASVTLQPARTENVSELASIPSNVRISRAAIEAAVREHYPEVFRAAAGESATLMFVVSPDGSIQRHERLQTKRTRSDAAQVEVQELSRATGLRERSPEEPVIMDVVTFSPGQMGPGRVEVVWNRKLSPDQLNTTTERVPAGETPFRTSTGPMR
jgi:beta-lactamase regulating signal transducer with metallopeptidase domain